MEPHHELVGLMQQAARHASTLLDAGRQHLDAMRGQFIPGRPARGDARPTATSRGANAAFYTALMHHSGPAQPLGTVTPARARAAPFASICTSSSSPLAAQPRGSSSAASSALAGTPLMQLAAATAEAPSLTPPLDRGRPAPGNAGQPLSAERKAELGRATWTLLHMLAAQFPERPTRQQRRDARQLVECLTRIYPCGSCASHFAQIVRCGDDVLRQIFFLTA